jgi:imidazolonepropionase
MGMTPAEAICAGTINAAYAIARDEEVGSVEKGKKADLVVYDVEDYREIPARAGINLSAMVLKEGEVVWEREGFWEKSEVGI